MDPQILGHRPDPTVNIEEKNMLDGGGTNYKKFKGNFFMKTVCQTTDILNFCTTFYFYFLIFWEIWDVFFSFQAEFLSQ